MTKESEGQSNIRIGGNVNGVNVNIGSTQTVHGDLSVSVGALPASQPKTREALIEEIKQLLAELEKAPFNQSDDVQAVKIAVQDAVDEANKPQPDKKRLEIRGKSLIQAAKNLAMVAPFVVQIAKTLLMIG